MEREYMKKHVRWTEGAGREVNDKIVFPIELALGFMYKQIILFNVCPGTTDEK